MYVQSAQAEICINQDHQFDNGHGCPTAIRGTELNSRGYENSNDKCIQLN